MTAFFLLSGFSLYLTWNKRNLYDIVEIKRFYIKRLIGILPLYYTVAFIYILFIGKETLLQNILIAPIEILGIQSTFNSLFEVTHNDGTWFISCILFCYLVYPLIQEFVKQIKNKTKINMICIVGIILLYSPFIVYYFHTNNIYSNPFFRMLEFIIGVILCSMLDNINKNKIFKYLFSWWAVLIEFLILFFGITIAVKFKISVGNYMLYNWIALPMFMLQIVSLSSLRFPKWMQNLKLIRYLCEISYAFFLGQFFTWKTTLFIIDKIGIDTNIIRIIISFIVCLIYSILLHEIVEKPLCKVLKKKLLSI